MKIMSVIIRRKDFSEQSSRYAFLQRHYKKGKILDIGNIGGLYGGDGVINSPHLQFVQDASESEVYGFDLYSPKVHADKYKNQMTGNIEDTLPYQDNYFDTVYLGEVIEHIHNPGLVLKEIHRVMKEDGVFILDTPNAYHVKKLLKWFIQREENLGDPTHIIIYTPGSLVSLLKKNGFEVLILGEKNNNFFLRLLCKGMGNPLLVKAVKKDNQPQKSL
jgi:SAM-dependent methyltransferase